MRVLCPGCKKPIKIEDFGGITSDGKGKPLFWHTYCLLKNKLLSLKRYDFSKYGMQPSANNTGDWVNIKDIS